MSAQKPHFYFGNLPDFEKEAEEAKRMAKMPKAPSFSLDDMEQARKAAYEEGRLLGLEQAKNSIEQQTEILVQSLTDRIHALEQAEIARHDQSIDNSITIAAKAIEKLLPTLLLKEREALIYSALQDFFKDHIAKAALTLSVHPTMVEPMQKYLPILHPELSITDDNTLSDSQARLEWHDGVFTFKPDIMVEAILGTLRDYGAAAAEGLDDMARNTHNESEINKETDIDHE